MCSVLSQWTHELLLVFCRYNQCHKGLLQSSLTPQQHLWNSQKQWTALPAPPCPNSSVCMSSRVPCTHKHTLTLLPMHMLQTLAYISISWRPVSNPGSWTSPCPKVSDVAGLGWGLRMCICHKFPAEKAMAPHSCTLAWKIPWTEEPGGLQSMGLHRVRHDWSDLAAAAASFQMLLLVVVRRWHFILMFWPRHLACEILDPWPRMEPWSMHWKHGVLTTGSPEKSLEMALWEPELWCIHPQHTISSLVTGSIHR